MDDDRLQTAMRVRRFGGVDASIMVLFHYGVPELTADEESSSVA
jgi:hypothetical protein